jgi:hypothetical protein
MKTLGITLALLLSLAGAARSETTCADRNYFNPAWNDSQELIFSCRSPRNLLCVFREKTPDEWGKIRYGVELVDNEDPSKPEPNGSSSFVYREWMKWTDRQLSFDYNPGESRDYLSLHFSRERQTLKIRLRKGQWTAKYRFLSFDHWSAQPSMNENSKGSDTYACSAPLVPPSP